MQRDYVIDDDQINNHHEIPFPITTIQLHPFYFPIFHSRGSSFLARSPLDRNRRAPPRAVESIMIDLSTKKQRRLIEPGNVGRPVATRVAERGKSDGDGGNACQNHGHLIATSRN